MRLPVTALLLISCLAGCARYDRREVVASRPSTPDAAAEVAGKPERILKRKVAVARFTNESRYGTPSLFGESFNRDANLDRLGKQAADMLATELTRSGKFVVLERIDLNKLEAESGLWG